MEFSRNELKKMREILKEYGFNICYTKWCNGKIKGMDEFSKGRNRCKQCAIENNKECNNKNTIAYNRIKFKLKLGKKCELCGCDDIYMLEFDHLDQKEKNFTIGKTRSVSKIIEESKKTRLICIWCHRLHSKKQREENVLKDKEDYDYTEKENNEVIDMSNSKTCNGKFCNGRLRNKKWFYISKNKWKSLCKKCIGYNCLLNRIENRNYVKNIKIKIESCQKCDKKVTLETICCFDFDHIDLDTKKDNIAKLSQYNYDAKEKIDLEIAKCQLLCCYCHKKKTMDDLNYTKLDMSKIYRLDNLPKKESVKCLKCSIEINSRTTLCFKCYSIDRRKIERPTYEILKEEIKEFGYVGTGRKYGVTDNTIRKWVKWYKKNI